MQATDEREFRRIQRSLAIPRALSPPLVEKVEEAHPDLPVAMTPHFLLRFVGEGSIRHPITAPDRIRRALVF